MPKARRSRNWYGHYGGPGNRIDDEFVRTHPPIDADDRAYLAHDRRYNGLQKKYGRYTPYFLASKADELLVSDLAHSSKPFARGARFWFNLKSKLSPFPLLINESVSNRNRLRAEREYGYHLATPALLPAYTPPSSDAGDMNDGYSYGARGSYQGRFSKPRPARVGKFAIRGYRREREEFGSQSQNDVCYLGLSSVTPKEIGQVVGCAFLRNVMKRHYRVDYEDERDSVIAGISPLVPFPSRIAFWREVRPSVAVATAYNVEAIYTFVATDTVRDFGQWFETNVFNAAGFGGGYYTTDAAAIVAYQDIVSLYAYQFFEPSGVMDSAIIDFPGGYTLAAAGNPTFPLIEHTPLDPGGSTVNNDAVITPVTFYQATQREREMIPVRIDGMYLTCYSKADMHIQNVTTADQGGDTSLLDDRIDSNPVRGRIFKFKGPLPLIKNNRNVGPGTGYGPDESFRLMVDPNGDGIIKPSTELLGSWRGVPSADMFENCTGITSVSLEPGAIRNFTMQFKFSGLLINLIRGFAATIDSVRFPAAGRHNALGTCMLMALEKRVRTGSGPDGQKVSVNWHADIYSGAVMGRSKPTTMNRAVMVPGTLVSGVDTTTVAATATTDA